MPCFRMVTSFDLCTTTGVRGSPWWPLYSGNLLHRMQSLWRPLLRTMAAGLTGRPACLFVSNIDTESRVANGDMINYLIFFFFLKLIRHSICATDRHGWYFCSYTFSSDWNSWVNFLCCDLVLLLGCWVCLGATKGRHLLHRMTSVRRLRCGRWLWGVAAVGTLVIL